MPVARDRIIISTANFGNAVCRFVAYLGRPILLDELLYQPAHSLIRQSYHALERRDPVNGDGFGVGFYLPDLDPEPALFLSVEPAWSNRNLRHNAPKFRSGCILAHVRAASMGGVSLENCHPFQFGELLMMHNGDVAGFRRIKRRLRERLSDETYDWIAGSTDTEHFFALFVDHLLKARRNHVEADDVVMALRATMADIKEMQVEADVQRATFLNLCVSNGRFLVALRYCDDPDHAPHSLYFCEGSRYECEGGVCRVEQASPANRVVLISSERLTEQPGVFRPVPAGHFVTVSGPELEVSVFPA